MKKNNLQKRPMRKKPSDPGPPPPKSPRRCSLGLVRRLDSATSSRNLAPLSCCRQASLEALARNAFEALDQGRPPPISASKGWLKLVPPVAGGWYGNPRVLRKWLVSLVTQETCDHGKWVNYRTLQTTYQVPCAVSDLPHFGFSVQVGSSWSPAVWRWRCPIGIQMA